MKKLLKKIRYWLIRKLGGFTEQQIIQLQPPIIRQASVKTEEVSSTIRVTCLDFTCRLEKEERYKRLAIKEMQTDLLKYIDFTIIDNPKEYVKEIRARLKVVVPGSSTWI